MKKETVIKVIAYSGAAIGLASAFWVLPNLGKFTSSLGSSPTGIMHPMDEESKKQFNTGMFMLVTGFVLISSARIIDGK